MRHLFTALIGFVLLGSALACNHTAGVCDCGNYTPCAGSCCAVTAHPAPVGPIIHPEPLRVMPQGSVKEE